MLGRAGWIVRALGIAKRPEMAEAMMRHRFATWWSDVEVTVPTQGYRRCTRKTSPDHAPTFGIFQNLAADIFAFVDFVPV